MRKARHSPADTSGRGGGTDRCTTEDARKDARAGRRAVVVRFDEGDTGEASREAEAVIIEALEREWQRADAVVLSDYGYGTLTPGVISVVSDLQARRPRVVAVDSKMLERFAGCGRRW